MKEIMMYTTAFILAVLLFFAYLGWKTQNSNTLPEVYGVR